MSEDKKGVKSQSQTSQAAPVASRPAAPAGIFNKKQTVEKSQNPVRVTVIKSLIDSYSVKGGLNQQVDVARKAYKDLVSAIEQIQTLTGVDLRDCLAYLIKAIADNDNKAYGREAVFRFLPEVAKPGVMERVSRLLNMALFYASSSNSYFHQMVDVAFSVNLVVNQEVRDQIAAYFNA